MLNQDASDQPFQVALLAAESKRGYWTAFRVTKSATLAEDAVQEAYASFLRQPPDYQGEEQMRNCFLIAVRRRALIIMRSERSRRRREERIAGISPKITNEEHDPRTDEMAQAARLALNSLPLEEREAVGLCCEQGLTRESAAEVLGIPKATLARRVNRGLEKLRKILAQQGYAVATPLAVSAALSSLPLPAVPATLTAALQNLTTNPALAARYASAVSAKILSAASGKKTAGLFWVLLPLTLLSATVAGLWWRQTQTIPAATTAKSDDNQAVSPTENGEELYHCWTFEDGPPEGFQTAKGKWEWRRNPRTNRGEMFAFGDEQTAVIPPVKMPSRPFEVKITVEPLLLADINHLIKNAKQSDKWSKNEFNWPTAYTAYWASPEGKFSANVWASSVTKPSDEPTTMRIVFVKRHIFQYLQDGSINRVTEYERPYPDDKFFIFVKNSIISKIEVRLLRDEEIGDETNEPQKVVERFNLQLWGKVGPRNEKTTAR